MAKDNPTSTGVYDDDVVRLFFGATVLWAIVGMLVGVIIALQLAYWPANLGVPYLTFSHLRPLHTNAVIFAFAGNAVFTGIYYSLQRLCKVRMFNDMLSRIHFWGWQAIIVSAALTLPFGFTTGKEYAELIWPIDLAIAVVWVLFAINFFGTLATRKVQHMYVAIWFYMSFVLTVPVLHIVNSLELPATFGRSYPIYSGMTDALVQWWYGHNAVAFFLTTPFLGLMYYFMPKAAEKPVFSYRLSIIHFWALVFLYIWAGPHHLLYSGLPDWVQTVGSAFSVMLIAPSWGGMLNGLLTLRGAWDRLRTDAIIKFFVVGISFYGISTFEGPMMSIRDINALTHFTNWNIAHVHGGALGWNGMITFGMLYWLAPRLWGKVHNEGWVNLHFWMSTIAVVLYIVSMWAAGLTEGLMSRAIAPDGLLQYPNFVDMVARMNPFYWTRFVGGTLYLSGVILMAINLLLTVRDSRGGNSAPLSAAAAK